MISSAVQREFISVSRLYALLEKRSVADSVPASQVELEDKFSAALIKPLEEFYSMPFKNGFDGIPTSSQSSITDWLKDQFTKHPEWSDEMKSVLEVYISKIVSIGISEALNLLGKKEKEIVLTEESVVSGVQSRAESLMLPSSNESLTNTTINDLAYALFGAVLAGTALAGALLLLSDRIKIRSLLIADYESNRGLNIGLIETYKRNGIVHMIYSARDDACKICKPDNGKQFMIPIPAEKILPRHNHCRCIYLPDKDNWNPPTEFWIG